MQNYRKKLIFLIFFLSITLIYSENCHTQWIQTNGPNGGWCRCLYAFNGYIFAGSNEGGLFRSSDNGNTWNFVFNLSSVYACDINGITSLGTYLFIATNSYGVYRSSDNGNTFQAFSNGLPNLGTINSIVTSGQYVICGGYKPYRTSNYGLSWDSCANGMSGYTYIYSFSSIGTNTYACRMNGAYKSSNNGNNWVPINNGFNTTTITTIGSDGINLYAGSSSGIYKSTNEGNNWVQINNGIPSLWIHQFGYNGIYLFVATGEGNYRTSNGGANWEPCNYFGRSRNTIYNK
jgi:photosystem II stability/assembly factor-like uncharacterized protein